MAVNAAELAGQPEAGFVPPCFELQQISDPAAGLGKAWSAVFGLAAGIYLQHPRRSPPNWPGVRPEG